MNNMPVFYCGDREPLPEGYDGYDTRYNCLRKGVGIGLNKRMRRPEKRPGGFFSTKWGYVLIGFLVLLLIVIFLLILFLYFR
jgi:hypothetical protein